MKRCRISLNIAAIRLREMPSAGRPSASPTAVPSRQPRMGVCRSGFTRINHLALLAVLHNASGRFPRNSRKSPSQQRMGVAKIREPSLWHPPPHGESLHQLLRRQGGKSGIDDGIDIESGDVGVNGLDCRLHISAICGEQGGSRFARGLALGKEPTHFKSP